MEGRKDTKGRVGTKEKVERRVKVKSGKERGKWRQGKGEREVKVKMEGREKEGGK